MARRYTKKTHAKFLVEVLEGRTCLMCPGAMKTGGTFELQKWKNLPCKICQEFVGLKYVGPMFKGETKISPCPCSAMTRAEAKKRSWLAIEAKFPELLME